MLAFISKKFEVNNNNINNKEVQDEKKPSAHLCDPVLGLLHEYMGQEPSFMEVFLHTRPGRPGMSP